MWKVWPIMNIIGFIYSLFCSLYLRDLLLDIESISNFLSSYGCWCITVIVFRYGLVYFLRTLYLCIFISQHIWQFLASSFVEIHMYVNIVFIFIRRSDGIVMEGILKFDWPIPSSQSWWQIKNKRSHPAPKSWFLIEFSKKRN